LILQPTIPLVSLSSGRRLLRLLNEESAGRPIEDLWIPFFCVSTNLSRAQQVVHDRGNLALSVRASVSLPGVLPPVREDTDLLVDGGLLNNLPVDVMQRVLGGGRVVAVDLRRQIELRMHAAWGPELSGWEVLWRRLLPGGKASKPPGIGSILMRTVELAGLLTERDLVGRPGIDVYLQPPVAQWGTFDFKSAPLLVDEAYRYAAGELRRLPLAELFDA
jgi:predicted acylesterase/phospholipase RssA